MAYKYNRVVASIHLMHKMNYSVTFSIFNAHSHEFVRQSRVFVQSPEIQQFVVQLNNGEIPEEFRKVCWKECRILENAMEDAISAASESMKNILQWNGPFQVECAVNTAVVPGYVHE